jgi:hypothetical protein
MPSVMVTVNPSCLVSAVAFIWLVASVDVRTLPDAARSATRKNPPRQNKFTGRTVAEADLVAAWLSVRLTDWPQRMREQIQAG